MARYAANLSMLFTDLPFLRRFEAAASAGFEAVRTEVVRPGVWSRIWPFDREYLVLFRRVRP